MEEVGAQVAHHPIYIHHHHHPPLSKKRDLPFRNHHGFENETPIMGNWNPNHWEWDSVRFIAKPVEKPNSNPIPNPNPTPKPNPNLSLKLGVEEALNKRVRSGSPGSSSSTYPMCQVDNCREDLSTAKDYHRRHKVCEIHSKSTKALVAMVMQRFCQQCSRFHPLSEFDEGKRSCRRRLAGHNRRRRKTTTQADDVVSMDNNPAANLDIVNLLTVLARAQGNNEDKNGNNSEVPERNQLMQILNKINNLPLHTDFPSVKLPVPESISSSFQQQQGNVIEHQKKFNGNVNNSSKSTMDLLTILSSTLAESAAPDDAVAVAVSQSSTHNSSYGEKNKLASCNAPNLEFSSVPVMAERRSNSYQSTPVEDSGSSRVNVNLPLQLFSSSPEEDDRRLPKLPSTSKYFSSDSSNQMDDGSPSSSPVVELFPVVQKTTTKQTRKPPEKRICREITSLELFGGGPTSTRRVAADIGSFQSSPYQAGYASSSGSDHSPPSSSSSDAQDRTGRILFKLFDKDPSMIPGTLRTQIFNWLSNSPTEMESYIRPGCVVISIYVSLSSILWEQLEENLLLRVGSLVEAIDSDFWKSGRFLVYTGKLLASHKNGKIRVCKSWRTRKAPELILVTPLAVVAGIETCFTLKGRNLMNPGTKIHCTDMGGYTSKDVHESPHDTAYDEISFGNFKFDGASSSRCFIEVENDFKGNSFPVIIADALICRELRLLESELNKDTKMLDAVMSEEHNNNNNNERSRSREEVLHFLNELGWLFQRKKRFASMQMFIIPNYSLSRFKYLLGFSIERDFCALVKEVLDIFVHGNRDGDALSVQGMEMLSEVQLLHCAVKRKCRKMVDLLINYSIFTTTDDPKTYIFPPNISGPGGLTPLHLAACTSGSDDMVDCLTNDPQKIGVSCWNSLLDMNGQSPHAYAASRNNHSYNRLVAQKISDRRNGQVSLSIENERPAITQFKREIASTSTRVGSSSSCTKCAVVAAKYHRRISGTQSMFHQPFIHSMLAVAAVCVCVCIFFRGSPYTGLVIPFKWENLDFGTS